MRLLHITLALALGSGCAALARKQTEPFREAAKLVWEAYGVSDRCPLPTIGVELPSTCEDGWEDHGRCFSGVYIVGDNHAVVVAKIGERPSQTALAHELLHAALACMGNSDTDHVTKVWDWVPSKMNTALFEHDL